MQGLELLLSDDLAFLLPLKVLVEGIVGGQLKSARRTRAGLPEPPFHALHVEQVLARQLDRRFFAALKVPQANGTLFARNRLFADAVFLLQSRLEPGLRRRRNERRRAAEASDVPIVDIESAGDAAVQKQPRQVQVIVGPLVIAERLAIVLIKIAAHLNVEMFGEIEMNARKIFDSC